MGVYDNAIASAANLIAKYGAVITLRRTATDNTVTEFPAIVVLTGRARHYIEGSGVEIGDWKMILDASVEPVEQDSFTLGGDRYIVQRAEPLQPGGVTVIWNAWARQS